MLFRSTVIAVDPVKWPDTNTEAVDVFVEWLTSKKTLERIADFGVDEYGEPLFFINYKAE